LNAFLWSSEFRILAVQVHVMASALMLVVVFVPMLIEARRAAANERAQQARGGVEAAGDVYPVMRIAYPVAFLLMIAEGAFRGGPSRGVLGLGLVLFLAAKSLKWSAILSLGRCWTFRVITVPRETLVTRGPYRLFRHPNYVGVAGELAGVALMSGAPIAGPLATLGFSVLMWKRITVEERALQAAASTTLPNP
jgi:methyltransferase